jgi:hypothetical protein
MEFMMPSTRAFAWLSLYKKELADSSAGKISYFYKTKI